MTKRIAISSLDDHPLHCNHLSKSTHLMLKSHIKRTGWYEPLTVRPQGGGRFQILNGHHRCRILLELGHRAARCDVWDVGDSEALVLLATLNRFIGRDKPFGRVALVKRLHHHFSSREVAEMLPETAAQIRKLLAVDGMPPAPAAPAQVAAAPRALTFFVNEEAAAKIEAALGAAARGQPGGRAAALVRIAERALEE